MRRYVFRLTMLTLAVLGPGAVRGDDQQIAEQIVQRLQEEKQAGNLKGFSIDLQVDDGTVWLSGHVANSEQQAKALDIARRIRGVNQVVNDLAVAGTAPAATSLPKSAPVAIAPPAASTSPPVVINPYLAGAAESSASIAATPASSQNSMLGNMSKAFTGALPRPLPKPERQSVQPALASQDFASASLPSAIGSGVDPSATPTMRQAVVQTAQPIVNAPQPLSAASLPQSAGQEQWAGGYPQAGMPMMVAVPVYAGSRMQVPVPMGPARTVGYTTGAEGTSGGPTPMYMPGSGVGIAPARYDHPSMPGYAWPSYAAYPNYGAVTYPKQYSASAWPYIGPFYPYPQVPLGWRKVTLEWDDGWWMLDFKDRRSMYNKH